MSRALPLHPMVVLLAVTTGGVLGGIIGAALATPVTAAAVIAGGFARERWTGGDSHRDATAEPAEADR